MSEHAARYFASGREAGIERARLSHIERRYDGFTRDVLRNTGAVRPGAAILEAGPGAGAMLAWFAGETGPEGDVLGIDIDPSCLPDLAAPVRVRQGDISAPAPPDEAERFDLAYARLLFEHLDRPETAIEAFAGWVKPGGSIALFDLDCSGVAAATGHGEDAAVFDAGTKAVLGAAREQGLFDAFLGGRHAEILERLGFEAIAEHRFERAVEGGSDWGVFMAENNLALAQMLGVAEAAAPVSELMARPGFRFIDQTLVGVTGRKPAG